MIPTSKAKEIATSFALYMNVRTPFGKQLDDWASSKEAAAILSGEDWKEDGGGTRDEFIQFVRELIKKHPLQEPFYTMARKVMGKIPTYVKNDEV